MFRPYIALAIVFSFVSSDAFGLSCVRPSEKELVAKYEHIFIVFFTDATFYADGDSAPFKGKIIANFDVLSVIKGNPDRVPYAEANISGPNSPWPATIPIGQKYILVANDGPAQWSACSHIFRVPAEHFENCQEYSLRKFAGEDIPERISRRRKTVKCGKLEHPKATRAVMTHAGPICDFIARIYGLRQVSRVTCRNARVE